MNHSNATLQTVTAALCVFLAVTTACPVFAAGPELFWVQYSEQIADLAATKGVCVAKLRRRATEATEAYLVFEATKSIWGDKPAALVVFAHPEYRFVADGPRVIMRQEDIDALREGQSYVIRFSDEDLQEWRLLKDAGEEAPVRKMVAELERAQRALKLDPWDAVGGEDPYERSVGFAHCQRDIATSVEALLRRYAQAKSATRVQHSLIREILQHSKWRHLTLAADVLHAVCERAMVDSGDDAFAGSVRGQIMGSAIRLLGQRLDGRCDAFILKSLGGENEQFRQAALSALCVRKIPESVPVLWEQLRAGRVSNPPGLIAPIVCQQGAPGVTQVLEFYRTHREQLQDGLRLPAAAREYLDQSHIATLKDLRVTRGRQLPSQPVELLIWAGDPDAGEEARRMAEDGRLRSLPYASDPGLRKFAKAWAPAARVLLRARPSNGADFQSAVAALRYANDPELPDLLAAATKDEAFGYWALQDLQEVCLEKHRPILKEFASIRVVPGRSPHAPASAAEYRLFALSGLAHLGDRDAMRQMIRAAFLSPETSVRATAGETVLPTMDSDKLIAAWQASLPSAADAIGVAVHGYVLERLKTWKDGKRPMPRFDPSL